MINVLDRFEGRSGGSCRRLRDPGTKITGGRYQIPESSFAHGFGADTTVCKAVHRPVREAISTWGDAAAGRRYGGYREYFDGRRELALPGEGFVFAGLREV